jgi:hypothetical protein
MRATAKQSPYSRSGTEEEEEEEEKDEEEEEDDPFGQFGLWAPSSGVRDLSTLTHVCFHITPPSSKSRDMLVMSRKHR